MTQRLSYYDVAKTFSDAGCTLLSGDYINARQLLDYRCNCGNLSKITYDSFKRGRRCKECGRKKITEKQRFSFDEVAVTFERAGCLLLESTYISAGTPMRYLCSCGDESAITYSRFKSGGRCMRCGTERASEQLRYSYESVKRVFEESGCTLLDETYKNNITPMSYICSCGRKSLIDFYRFRNGGRCQSCGYKKMAESQRLEESNVRASLEEHGYVLLGSYVNAVTPIQCRCEKGHDLEISYSNFSNGVRCRFCFWDVNRGDHHHKWNPNLTGDDRERERNIEGIQDWRRAVFSRDGYKCQKCGAVGVLLNAHHIFNYSSNKSLRVDVGNGITFCYQCHRDFHKTYGSKDNNLKQSMEFIN